MLLINELITSTRSVRYRSTHKATLTITSRAWRSNKPIARHRERCRGLGFVATVVRYLVCLMCHDATVSIKSSDTRTRTALSSWYSTTKRAVARDAPRPGARQAYARRSARLVACEAFAEAPRATSVQTYRRARNLISPIFKPENSQDARRRKS